MFSRLPIPSFRLAIYFGAISVLWIAAAFIREFLVIAALCDVLLIFVALLDLLVASSPNDFEVERNVSDKMNLGAANPVILSVHSRARRPLSLWVRDEPPASWPVHSPSNNAVFAAETSSKSLVAPPVARLLLETEPGKTTRGEYSITPTRRGEWTWGNLSFRYQSPLGLWHRQGKVAPVKGEETRVRVFPDTSEVHRYELRLREGRLRDIGLHLQRLRGKGSEFESLREYATGDDYKDINWKASARRGKLISTNYDIERDQTVIVAIDCGRMMTSMAVTRTARAGQRDLNQVEYSNVAVEELVTPLSKLDCAINAAVLLAHVSASMGDAVGVLLFADTVLGFVPPRKGRLQTGKIIDAMYAVQPRLVEPDYIGAYNYLLARKVRRSLVVTFTDLIDAEASRELLQASGALRRHHNALCVTINNRDVTDMAQILPQNSDELYSKAMAQRMLNGRLNALENLRRQGVGVLDTEARALTIATVNRYLDLKARGAL